MELSQTALAMLFLVGFPAGTLLHVAYALTDMGVGNAHLGRLLMRHVKDFAFMIAAGVVAVLLVYYVNNGEFRYLVLAGMIGGYAVSYVTLGKLVVHVRNIAVHALSVPLLWVWSITLGRLLSKLRVSARCKATQTRIDVLQQLALNGFEN
jgi:hypothetical protein